MISVKIHFKHVHAVGIYECASYKFDNGMVVLCGVPGNGHAFNTIMSPIDNVILFEADHSKIGR